MKKRFLQDIKDKYQQFQETKSGRWLSDAAYVLRLTFRWAYKLRSLVLSIPVAVVALALAVRNLAHLPAQVGLILQENGQYQFMISKGVAICMPLAITAVCLCMMLLSKKMLYPWLISVFSLVLPIALWFTYLFPG